MKISQRELLLTALLLLGTAGFGNADGKIGKLERLWTRQIGTSVYDQGGDLTVDFRGNTFVAGLTDGSLCGQSSGKRDVFISTLSGDGELNCFAHWGPTYSPPNASIARDVYGNVYVNTREPDADGERYYVVVLKYSREGKLQWSRRLGVNTGTYGVGTDRFGDVIVGWAAGFTSKVSSLDGAGNLNWTVEVPGRNPLTLAVDSSCGRITVATVEPDDSGFRAQGTQIDRCGTIRWTSDWQLGKAVAIQGMAHDKRGNAIICGASYGDDFSFVRKYGPDGKLVASRKINLKLHRLRQVATDSYGNIYTAGSISDHGRMFVTRYDPFLNEEWTEWFGGDTPGTVEGLSVDFPGLITISGSVSKSLHGEDPFGNFDAFVTRFRIR